MAIFPVRYVNVYQGVNLRPGWAGLQGAELRVRQQLSRARLAQQGAATLEALAGPWIHPDDPSGSSDEHQ